MTKRVDEEAGKTTTSYNAHQQDDHGQPEGGLLRHCLRSSSVLNPSNAAPMPPLSSRERRTYDRLRRIEWWMDDSGKICGRPVGLDPLVGLLPVLGDGASALISLALVARAAPDLNKYTVVRMLVNVWIDAVVGTIPLVGDLFDVGWKANSRNVAIFEDHMKRGGSERQDMDRKWLISVVIGFFVACFFCTMATIGLTVVLVLYVVHVLGSS